MKNWKRWILWTLLWIYAILTAIYGIIDEQSQCQDFLPVALFDCYEDAVRAIGGFELYHSIHPLIDFPLIVGPYFILIYLTVKLLEKIILFIKGYLSKQHHAINTNV